MREARRREPVVFGAEEKAQQRRRPPRERIPAAGEGRDAQQKGKMLDLNYGGKTVADEKKAKKTTARPKMDPQKKEAQDYPMGRADGPGFWGLCCLARLR